MLLVIVLGGCGDGGPQAYAAAREQAVTVMETALHAAVAPGHEIPTVEFRDIDCFWLQSYGAYVSVPRDDLVADPFETIGAAMRAQGFTVTVVPGRSFDILNATDGTYLQVTESFMNDRSEGFVTFNVDTGCYRSWPRDSWEPFLLINLAGLTGVSVWWIYRRTARRRQ